MNVRDFLIILERELEPFGEIDISSDYAWRAGPAPGIYQKLEEVFEENTVYRIAPLPWDKDD